MNKGSREKTKLYNFRILPSLLRRLKERAGNIPVSVVIRRLIEKYIRGEVGLD